MRSHVSESIRPLFVHLVDSISLNESLIWSGENPRIPKVLLAFRNFSLGALSDSKSGKVRCQEPGLNPETGGRCPAAVRPVWDGYEGPLGLLGRVFQVLIGKVQTGLIRPDLVIPPHRECW